MKTARLDARQPRRAPPARSAPSWSTAASSRPKTPSACCCYQKEHNLRFGEAAVRLGLISEADVQFALSRQFAYAYLRKMPGETRGRERRARRRLPAVQLARRAAARDPQPAHAALVRPGRGAPGADDRRRRARRGPHLPRGQPRRRLRAARRAHAAGRRRHAHAAPALAVLAREPDRLLDHARRALARGGDRPHSRPRRPVGAARRADAAESARAAEPAQLRGVHDPACAACTTSSSSTRRR